MRTITFFIYLLFLILGVKQNSYANIQESLTDKFSVQNLTTDFQSKYTINEQISTLIEDTDLDSDEDQIKNNSRKNRPDDKSIILKSSFVSNCNVILPHSSCPNNHNNFKNHTSFSIQPLPIYLKNRVLRI